MKFSLDLKMNDNIKEFLQETSEKKELILNAIGLECESKAKQLCPVDTGRLRNSITYAISPADNEVVIGTNVEYAPSVEFRDMQHKVGQAHFLRDGIVTSKSNIEKIVEAYLKI